LTGDAGAGKTRLAEEVATVARAEHHGYVLEGRCVPYGESNVWWPLAEALRRACGITPTDDHSAAKAKGLRAVSTMLDLDPGDKEVKRVLRGLVYLMEQDELGELEPARARDEAVRSLAVALERLTVHRPLVFIVSELHWADDLLLEFLDRLLDRVQHLPVLLVATARPELADRWHPPAGRHNQLVLHVDPLDTAATEDLLVTLLEGAVPAHLHHALVERSGGNPLFLEELVALVGGDQPVGDLPVTLRGLVAARLDALGPSERGTLEDAAVVGRIGTPEALVAMAGPGRQAEVEAALAMLAADDFLALGESRTDGREWEFRSELVREVAYAILSKSERARRHAALADWLATRAGERPGAADVDELAHHYGAAADIAIELGGVEGVAVDIAAKAARWLEEAAGRAQAEELWLGASGLLDQAMRLAPATDTAMRERLLLARARARLGRREAEGARADITEALAAARSRGDDAAEVQGLVLTGELERIEGRLGDSAATLNRAVRLARQIGDDQAIADAMRTLGQTLLFTGDDIGADVASQEALRAYRILGDRRGEAWALQSLAWTAFMRGDLVPAEERLAESAAAFSEIGDWGGHAWAQGLLAWVRFSEGRLDDAEALAHSIAKETGESGDRWAMGMMTVLRASVDLWKGRSHSAVERAQRAQQLFVEVRDSWGETQSLVPLIRGLLALGEIDAARSLLRDLTDRARDVSDVRMRRLAEGAVVIAITQQLGEGPALGDLARRVVEDRPHEATPEQRAIRGLGLLQAGEVESAVDVLEEAAGFDEGPETSANIGPMFAFALLAAGRLDDADRVLAASAPPGEGTYADQVWAGIARAFLLHRQGHSSASGSPLAPVAGVGSAAALALAEAEAVADGTQDRLAQATVRLARARLLRAAGAPEADEAAARASDRLGALGVDLAGWVRVFDLAAARSPHAASGAV
jgi:tetratricopeptide (TPR) repeat protein